MNKVMLIGYVGKEPEVHYYDTDQCVASFPLATTERGYTLANGTKVPDHTRNRLTLCNKYSISILIFFLLQQYKPHA